MKPELLRLLDVLGHAKPVQAADLAKLKKVFALLAKESRRVDIGSRVTPRKRPENYHGWYWRNREAVLAHMKARRQASREAR